MAIDLFVLIMVVLIFVGFVGVILYSFFDPVFQQNKKILIRGLKSSFGQKKEANSILCPQ
jgi:hypothetical protein